ncbi:MAG: 4Fe-4S binding protein [bacterium]|nr:4Fe-4S binding protein [bacterium]
MTVAKPVCPGLCTACGQCAQRCPAGAVALALRGPEIDHLCVACGTCIENCPEEALAWPAEGSEG